MKVVILCGGQGTRIRDVSDELPKPMIPIGSYPIVKHIMDIYSLHGFDEFVLCLGYKGWKLKEYFINYRNATSDVVVDMRGRGSVTCVGQSDVPSWSVTLAETGLNAMTGCRVKRIQKYVGNEPFMLTYGDGVGNVDIEALFRFHKSHGKLATITAVRPPSRFGELSIDRERVTSFEEKPQVSEGVINGGFFVCEPGVFEYVTDEESCIFEREPLQNLAHDGQLMMYKHEGFWMPMDTYREYKLLNDMYRSGRAEWLDAPPRG